MNGERNIESRVFLATCICTQFGHWTLADDSEREKKTQRETIKRKHKKQNYNMNMMIEWELQLSS